MFVSLKLTLLGEQFKNLRTVKGRHGLGAINDPHNKLKGHFHSPCNRLVGERNHRLLHSSLPVLATVVGRGFGPLLTRLGSAGSATISGKWLGGQGPGAAPLITMR